MWALLQIELLNIPLFVKDLKGQGLLRQACWFHARCFRHIAMGRRNWLHTESHFAAQNIAFMFGLLESCKLNNVNFGEYIEDILTRIFMGEEVDASFLPCDYVRHFKDGMDAEVTKPAQVVA